MASVVAGRTLARSMGAARGVRRQFVSRTPATTLQQRSFTAGAKVWEKRYTEDHEWVELSEDGTTGTIGISSYAANALGDVVFVELPTADLEVSAGDSIGAVESVKSASDIMTPVSGVIIAANSVLEDKPATINQSPEGEGWLAKIRIADKSEVEALKSEEEYRKFTEEAEDH